MYDRGTCTMSVCDSPRAILATIKIKVKKCELKYGGNKANTKSKATPLHSTTNQLQAGRLDVVQIGLRRESE